MIYREVTGLVTLKILRPYHIKVNEKYVHLRLENQFFTIYLNGEEYQFIPIEAKEIRVDRETKKIDNVDAKFAFQKGEDVVYISMAKLIYHPDFLNQVYQIAKPYYYKDFQDTLIDKSEVDLIIDELEQENKKRLIDKALDERDEKLFYKLLETL